MTINYQEHITQNSLVSGVIMSENTEELTNDTKQKILDLLFGKIVSLNSQGLYELEISQVYKGYETLPEGYGYKGGVARLLLELNLGLIDYGKPRDIDLIRYSDIKTCETMDEELAMKYMPDDYRHGDGVEVIGDNYFETRDFTINEVMVQGNNLIFTKQCLEDIVSQTIRPTEFTYDEYYNTHNYSIFIKSLRFYVNYYQRYGNAQLSLINKEQIFSNYTNLFWIALNLDRATGSGYDYGNHLLKVLQFIGQLPNEIVSIEEAKEFIEDSGWVENFEFRNIKDKTENSFVGIGQNNYEEYQSQITPLRQRIWE